MRYQGNRYPNSITPGKPKIDFFTKEWKIVTLNKILTQIFRPISLEDEKAYQLVTVKRNRGGVVRREVLLGKQIKTANQHILKAGDFLIARRQIIHGACEFVPEDLDNSIVSSEYDIFQTKPDLLPEYLKFLIHTTYLQQTFFQSSIGVDVEKMVFKTNRWLKFPIALPPIAEQKKIAEILETCDRQIELTEKLINAKRKLKQGLMQKLLTGKLRFSEFEGLEWKIVKLVEICSKITDGVHSTPEYKSDGISFLSVNNLTNEKINFRNCKYIDLESHQKLIERCRPEKGDVLMGKVATLGVSAVVEDDKQFSIFVQIALLKPKKIINSYFLKYTTELKSFRKKLNSNSSGTTIKYIGINQIGKIKINLPSIKEQEKIVDFLKKINNEIEILEKQKEYFLSQKKGLMQQLLTGKTRVNITP